MTRRSSTPALQRAGGVGVHLRTSPLFRAPRARLLVESFVVRVPSQSVEGPGEPPVPPPPGEEPPEVGRLVGYGSRVTGGSRLVRASSLAELRAAIAPGNHVVIEGSGTWNLAGNDLKVDVRDFTLDNRQAGVVFRGGALRIEKGAGNVLIRGVKSRPGDEYGDAQALDAITVNAEDGQIRGLYFDHVEAWWGPDVTFAILGDVADVTLDGVIVAGGLLRSDHPESRDGDGHGMGLNITALSNQRTGPQRITIYRSLIALNQTRNPQLRQAGPVDIIDSVIYGHGEAPYGNADGGLNIVGTIYRRGANSEPTASLGAGAFEAVPWRAVAKDGYLTPRSVYVANVVAQGFTFAPIDPRVVALSPAAPLSVASNGPNLEAVLSYVGGRSDRVSQDLFDDVRNGTGRYFNGSGLPGPNPYWY